MVSNFLSRTFKLIVDGDQTGTGASSSRPEYPEEDGFLVVGSSASDRTKVTASEFDGRINSPPKYDEVLGSEDLPTYNDYLSSQTTPQTENISNISQFNIQTNPLSPIADLPFSLSCDLLSINNLSHLDLTHSTCDYSLYEYDFLVEHSVLRDLESSRSKASTTEDLMQF
ncbi:hypothetical protein ScPMuIL_016684 [Solemya velum]